MVRETPFWVIIMLSIMAKVNMWIWEKGFMARHKSRYTKKLGIFEEK